ncbi:MAG: alkaline phosphatase family protein [Sandaracinaceae bacterium]
MRRVPTLPLLLAPILALACGPRVHDDRRLSDAIHSDEPPRLVVAVVIDQLGWSTYLRYREHLDPEGALARIAAQGRVHRVEYQHSATYTAAGHASIFTGASPRVHGVMANEVFVAGRGQVASCDDGRSLVFGTEDEYAAPTIVRVDTIADTLRAAHADARIVAVSLKDRGSVIPAGHHPDAVAFWDRRGERFTSSAYYGSAIPAWLEAFDARAPFAERVGQWTPQDPSMLEVTLGPDARAGEGGLGFGAEFPHDPREAGEEPAGSAFRGTPQAGELLADLALDAARALELGGDEVPDLLIVSFSNTDYVGHAFGLGSWEYLDNLIRTDRALGRLLDTLEAERGPLAVLVTSDHGHSDIAEATGGGRIVPRQLAAEVDAAIDSAIGEGDHALAYVEPFVYLSEDTLADDHRAPAMEAALGFLRAHAGVARAYDLVRAPPRADAEDPLERLAYESVADDPPAPIFVVLAEGFVVDDDEPFDAGAGHGTPCAYDREVPALFAGPGVEPASFDATAAPLDQRRVAATIGALLRIGPPAAGARDPLPGAP